MSRQAQVGAFALLALLLLFGVFYVITDFGTRHTGYRVGIHFQSAAGLHSGAVVYFSGVTVGTVDSITLLPDNTVDVILAINRDVDIPRTSRFLIQAPLTGDPNLIIVPPPPGRGPIVALERQVLPIDQQAVGTNTATIADLLEQGQGEIVKLDAMLSSLEKREPLLLDTLQQTLTNANTLTRTAQTAITSISADLQSSLAQASRNIVALTGTLNDSAQLNKAHINAILANFDATSHALNASMGALQSMATDPSLKSNLVATTKSIADTTANIASITRDLRSVTDDPQTQAQLRNTMANLDATMQRANSLLGGLGGTSSVYGVDANATPYPAAAPQASGQPPLPVATYPPLSSATYPPAPFAQPTANPELLKRRLTDVARQLIAIQVRMSELSPQTVCCLNPLLTSDNGPETDINAFVLPKASLGLMVGANNIGHGTTANAALLQEVNQNIRVGGGVLYSQAGVIGQYNAKLFNFQAELFNPQRPQLDYWGAFTVAHGLQIFAGERAANHQEHRFTYGVQAQIP
jgi:phospholipid/cholesterol/gamma-HCH transport system substrate-binding protein